MTPQEIRDLYLSTPKEHLALLEELLTTDTPMLGGTRIAINREWGELLDSYNTSRLVSYLSPTLTRSQSVALMANDHRLLSFLPSYPRASALSTLVSALALALVAPDPEHAGRLSAPLHSLLSIPSWALAPEWLNLIRESVPTLGIHKAIHAADLLRSHPSSKES